MANDTEILNRNLDTVLIPEMFDEINQWLETQPHALTKEEAEVIDNAVIAVYHSTVSFRSLLDEKLQEKDTEGLKEIAGKIKGLLRGILTRNNISREFIQDLYTRTIEGSTYWSLSLTRLGETEQDPLCSYVTTSNVAEIDGKGLDFYQDNPAAFFNQIKELTGPVNALYIPIETLVFLLGIPGIFSTGEQTPQEQEFIAKDLPLFFPMAHGKPTDAFGYMSTKLAKKDKYTKAITIEKNGVRLVIKQLSTLQATLGISTDKLLSTAIATFTEQNDFRHTATQRREVTIPLKEYAQIIGYDVEEHPTSTPEKADEEKRRAKIQMDNARRAIKKDLLLLQASALSWEETIKGKPRDFDSISLVTRVAIRNGEIKIYFSPEIAAYLAERNLITRYPTKLLGLDNRKSNAYYLGKKLVEYYHMDSNQLRGTNDRIGIPSLLAVTDLPSFEDVQQKDRGHWAERIKEPFERALDTLTQGGILKDWEYTHAKGVPLTNKEAANIINYRDFEALYLRFALMDEVDNADRLKRKQEEQANKKPSKKKPKTKKQ